MTGGGFAGRVVFVTGASGMVGSWLVRDLLGADASVIALVRDERRDSELIRSDDVRRTTRVRGSLHDIRLLQRTIVEYGVDIVFHLAAQTQVVVAERDPLGTMEANVRGTYNLLDAIRGGSPTTAVVVASSDKAYGHSDSLPYTESHPMAGRGIYDASKSAADLIAMAYARSYELKLAIARCGNIYGGGDTNWDRIVPGTIRSLLRGERPVLRSDGRPRRDYLYVRDAVAAYMRLGDALLAGTVSGEAFNFGHNAPISVTDIVDELRRIMGRGDLEPRILDQAALEIPDQYLDASKAERVLAWKPTFDLSTGLADTIEWYRDLLSA
jgi:CDP-glucose 4,6-dehydratase